MSSPSDSEQSIAKQMDLRTLADWVVRPRLRQIPGVAEVFVQGGHRKQYQILVDPAALLEYGISLEQVEQARFLLEQGCDLGQGYWFGRPIPAHELDWDRAPLIQA